MAPRLAERTNQAILAIFAVAALGISISEYANLRAVEAGRPAESLERLQVAQPWGGLAAREAARFLETRWRLDPEASADALFWQLHRYPLDPWRWLLMTRISRTLDSEIEALGTHMQAALASQGGSREVRWQAANLAQTIGNADLIIDHLRTWLVGQPHLTDRALFVAGRWVDEPGELVDRVLPPGDAFLERAMRYARTSRQVDLAQAVWARLDHPVTPDHPAGSDYIGTTQSAGRHDLTMAAWQAMDPQYQPGQFPAGHFGFPIEELPAFGWNLRAPAGVTIERVAIEADWHREPEIPDIASGDSGITEVDAGDSGMTEVDAGDSGMTATEEAEEPVVPESASADIRDLAGEDSEIPDIAVGDSGMTDSTSQQANQALAVTFDGTENVNLHTPYIRFPVAEPGRYRLTGWWKAAGLTTRSLPYLYLLTEDGDFRQRINVPSANFEWTPFEAEFEIAGDDLIRFQLIRRSTKAFDRYIEGRVVIAGLRVASVVGDDQDESAEISAGY